ncbi:hypothetical protein ACFQI7_03750 [Paenibacillus allorhizosphaerae]|uniref:ATP-binding cassette domain-containing protein n=1 Tax=Paenibacillus allorhizosphaerae TaxID=2849866 RepID=A0ABM8VD81_9BACL|nr:hypothetical protein [Paenibacillus allorhizosphaerae]CAG7624557.1 hypothetical protein PAECIP111802_01077 [Paenibacillus allorhizosphaerae]
MTQPVVVCKQVTKRYGKKIALDGLDVVIPAGRIVGVLGPYAQHNFSMDGRRKMTRRYGIIMQIRRQRSASRLRSRCNELAATSSKKRL